MYVVQRRTKLREHIEHSIQILMKYPKIILPEAIFSVVNLAFLLLNQDRILQLYNEYQITGTIDFGWEIYAIIAVFGILSFFWGVFFTPFIQHLKLDAIKDIEPDFMRSFEYSKGRYWEFLRATIAEIILMLGVLVIPFGLLMTIGVFNFSLGYVTLIYAISGLVLIVDIFVVAWIATAPSIMVWSGLGFRDSLILSYKFFRARLGILFSAGIVYAIVTSVIDYIPYSEYLNFIPYALYTLTELDIFLSYQNSTLSEINKSNVFEED